jgi:hypothetical protein
VLDGGPLHRRHRGAIALVLADYAKDLYGQTEDVCFEPLELAALGVGLACNGTYRAKGRERLESAAGEASKLNAFLTIAGHGKEALGDQAQVESARPKVDGKAAGADEAAARF